jgi:hypothetical protein
MIRLGVGPVRGIVADGVLVLAGDVQSSLLDLSVPTFARQERCRSIRAGNGARQPQSVRMLTTMLARLVGLAREVSMHSALSVLAG